MPEPSSEGFKFDLLTQRFIEKRWETPIGQEVLKEVVEGLKESVEIRCILDRYVLDHEANVAPYSHPHYPPDAMQPGSFWVLTQDDLRGVRVYNEKLAGCPSLEK